LLRWWCLHIRHEAFGWEKRRGVFEALEHSIGEAYIIESQDVEPLVGNREKRV
jgi:hypothetical protein